MSNYSLGGHGKPASHTGSCGMSCASEVEKMAEGKAFAGMGAHGQGGPSAMPSAQKSGAFRPDESVAEYPGNPRDDGSRRG